MRLHSCYFSKQNLETTVVSQGMLRMLFKGILLLASWKNDSSTPRLYVTVHQSVKFSMMVGGTYIYSGHCKVPDINRKSSVREGHYTSI